MSCQTLYTHRKFRGRISRTAKKFSGKAADRRETTVNERISIIASLVAASERLTKIPFYKLLYRQGRRG